MSIEFIADICGNHCKDINRTRKLIEEAKKAGCGAVKFQLFTAETLYAPEWAEKYEWIRANELPEEFIPQIAKICSEVGIEFGCSPFSMHAINLLEPHVDFFKIASYEILRIDLIKACIKTKKPLKFSTGLAINDEIIKVVELCDANNYKQNTTLFHCISSYPVLPKDTGLMRIQDLKNIFRYSTGWSDHSKSPSVIYAAIGQGASEIEFHLDLDDKQGTEYSMGHCWTASEIKEVIDNVRIMEEATTLKIVDEDFPQRLRRADPTDGLRTHKIIRPQIR